MNKKHGKPFAVDLNQLLGHHLLITGATGSGKSTTLLRLAEYLQDENQTGIIFDATGEFAQLENAVVYKLGVNANLPITDLSVEDITGILSLSSDFPQYKLSSAIQSLRIQRHVVKQAGKYVKLNRSIADFAQHVQSLRYSSVDYDGMLLGDQLIEEFVQPHSNSQSDFNMLGEQYDQSALQHYWDDILQAKLSLSEQRIQQNFGLNTAEVAKEQPQVTRVDLNYVLKLFSRMASKHRTLVIDISVLQDDAKMSKLIMNTILLRMLRIRETTVDRKPLTIFLDEYHRYMPSEQMLMDSGIFKLLREGRKYGLYTVLSTQSPLDLPVTLRGQFGSLLVHRLQDIAEIKNVLGNKRRWLKKIPQLEEGQGIIKLYGAKKGMAVTILAPKTEHETASPIFK